MPDGATLGAVARECPPATSGFRRLAALTEVILVFVLVHLCWRSFKHFTWLGHIAGQARQNYSAGVFMIAFAVIVIKLHRRRLVEFGLTLSDWRRKLDVGILWGVIPPLTLLVVIWMSGFRPKNFVRPGTPWGLALVGSALAIVYTLVYSAMDRRRRSPWPLAVSIALLIVLWSAPVLAAVYSHRPVGYMAGTVGWMILGAGFGEEIFFRGYILTRLDLTFGRPLSVWGTRFGVGLLVSSILFGLVHALNSVDYFGGRYQFDWPSGLFNCFVGVFYAAMRERTGSIFPGAIAHGISDVLTRIAG